MNTVPAPAAGRFATFSRSARVLRPLVNALMPRSLTPVVVRTGAARGTRLRIDPRREKFYWTGLYEREVQEVFQRILVEGGTMWDVGAHIGFFTALAARCVGSAGRVHAFEPQPENRRRLEETVKLNELSCVEVHPLALGSRVGAETLYGHGSTSTWSLMGRQGVETVDVSCVTLDELVAGGKFGTPQLVKIDAEGAEVDILRGGSTLAAQDVAFVIELGHASEVAAARGVLRDHMFVQLSARHWLAERRA